MTARFNPIPSLAGYTAGQVPSYDPATGALTQPLFVALPANGATDGTSLTNALAALGANGGVVRLVPGQTYVIDAPVVIPSNCTLNCSGATITRSASYPAGSLIQNKALTAQRAVTDGQMSSTSNPTFLNSATAAFTSADVGRVVNVTGVGQTGKTIFATINAVNSGTQAVLSVAALTTASAQTVTIFNRDKNIAIVGNQSTVLNAGSNTASFGPLPSISFPFRHVDGLTIDLGGGTVICGNTNGTIRPGDCTNLKVKSITLNNVSGADGIHLNGPINDFEVTDIFGATTDDFVALIPSYLSVDKDSATTNVYGPITNGYVGRLFPQNCYAAVDIADDGIVDPSGGTAGGCSQVTIDCAHGVSARSGVVVQGMNEGTSSINDITIRDIKMVTGGSPPLPVVNINATMENVHIQDVSWLSGSGSAGSQACVISINGVGGGIGYTDSITVDGVHIQAGDYVDAVQVGNLAGSNIRQILVKNVDMAFSPPHACNCVSVTGAGTIIVNLIVKELTIKEGANLANVVLLNANAQVYFCSISNFQVWGVAGIVTAASGTTFIGSGGINISDGQVYSGAGAITVGSSVNIRLNNLDLSGLSGGCIVTGTGTVRLLTNNCTFPAGNCSSPTGTTLSANGHSTPINIATLTPADGDMVYNSNGSLSCGAGVVVFHTGGTGNGWKNLYSGSTY